MAAMSVMRSCLGWILAAMLVPLAPAQVAHGQPPPVAPVLRWLRGDPVAFGGEGAPKATVYAFFSDDALLPSLAGDANYLVDLQRRWHERGAVVVAVVREATAEHERWGGCRLAQDADGALTASWRGETEVPLPVVVLDQRGVVTFLGSIEAGLVDALAATLDGTVQLGAERQRAALRLELPARFDDLTAAAVKQLQPAVAAAPRDGLLAGLLYLVQATKANDEEQAAATCQRALQQLAAEGRPLAVFADLALRGDPRRPGLAQQLKAPLQAAAAALPQDPVVQLALLRTLVLLGDGREVGRQAMRSRKLVTATAAHALEFASLLTLDGNAPAHRDLAQLAVQAAARLGAPPRLLVAAQYAIAGRCAQDPEQQKRLLDEYLKDNEMRVSLNNDCWYLMTELPTMGRFDLFAAGLAERMLEQRSSLDAFEFDTAALAMFLAGRPAEAVELQQAAIKKAGQDVNPEYNERLLRYQKGQQAAPR
jgi:hypothetical protein